MQMLSLHLRCSSRASPNATGSGLLLCSAAQRYLNGISMQENTRQKAVLVERYAALKGVPLRIGLQESDTISIVAVSITVIVL